MGEGVSILWEKVGQLRDSKMVVTWINTIALDSYRSSLRREPVLQELPDVPGSLETNLAAIDIRCVPKTCKNNGRLVLQRPYLKGYKAQEIADAQGWSETVVRLRLLRARRTRAKKVVAFSDTRG
jgi:DNA-directed RNA polymerase specialized sigma24 family protein